MIDVDNLKEFIKNNNLILKIWQKSTIERYNVFTQEINKIALISNDDKRMQSIALIEMYAYGTSKEIVSEKEDINCNNILKRWKKWLTLTMLQKKT